MRRMTRGLQRRAERACEDYGRVLLAQFSGRDGGDDTAHVFRDHRRLISARTIRALRDQAGADPEARALLGLALEWHLAEARELDQRRAGRIEARELVETAAGFRPLTSIRRLLACEPDPQRRRDLWASRDRIRAEQLDGHLVAARASERRALEQLGFKDRIEAFEAHAFPLEPLAERCRAFLDDTTAPLAELERQARAAVPAARSLPARLHGSDLGWLLRELSGPGSLATQELRRIYTGTMADLGIGTEGLGHVILDLEPLAQRSPRAFCMAIRIPEEVHLVMRPDGELPDLGMLMHEAGHAQHRAGTDGALGFCARALGDISVSESWAFLLEGLTGEPAWLGRWAPHGPATLPLASRYRRLLLARRNAASLIGELELERGWDEGDRDVARERYRELQEQAGGTEWSSSGWLADLDPGFYSARYLRGWMLAAGWRAELIRRFGLEWFGKEQAGRWLAALWAGGERRDAAELAEQVLGERLGFEWVLAELHSPPRTGAGAGVAAVPMATPEAELD